MLEHIDLRFFFLYNLICVSCKIKNFMVRSVTDPLLEVCELQKHKPHAGWM